MIEQHYKTTDLAALLSLNPETLRRAAARGEVKPVQIGKDVWKKYEGQMLWNRAASQLCRMLFGDCLGGAIYTAEELGAQVASPGGPLDDLPPVDPSGFVDEREPERVTEPEPEGEPLSGEVVQPLFSEAQAQRRREYEA